MTPEDMLERITTWEDTETRSERYVDQEKLAVVLADLEEGISRVTK